MNKKDIRDYFLIAAGLTLLYFQGNKLDGYTLNDFNNSYNDYIQCVNFSKNIFSNLSDSSVYFPSSSRSSLVDVDCDGSIDATIRWESGRAGAVYQAFPYEVNENE